MITHNGKYLLHATHHGMPIYAATMGGKMVIGYGLLSATHQAILAAFGFAEGVQVIAKTNNYLNRIATTDPQRALLLAGFINEDPMLVCSLVETSKVRKLESDGVAYIDTGIRADTPLMSFECLADMTGLTAYPKSLFGTIGGYGPGSGMYGVIYHSQGGIGFRVGNYSSNYVSTGLDAKSTNANLLGIVRESDFELFVNGFSKGNKAKGTPAAKPMYLFGTWIDTNNSKTNSRIAFIRFFTSDTDIAHFIPMQRTDGTCGMLDIISSTFHPNANTQGAFTIQLTDKA